MLTVIDETCEALQVANQLLDVSYADPDDDLRLLSRQLLRAHEYAAHLEAQLREAERDLLRVSQLVCESCRINVAIGSWASTGREQQAMTSQACVTPGEVRYDRARRYVCDGRVWVDATLSAMDQDTYPRTTHRMILHRHKWHRVWSNAWCAPALTKDESWAGGFVFDEHECRYTSISGTCDARSELKGCHVE